MNKYIRAAICIVYSFVKFCFMKMFHFSGFKFSVFNIISPFTTIDLDRGATLILGKMVRMRSSSKIKVRKGAHINIGANSSLNHGCMFVAHESIIVGDNVQFGPNVLIYDHDHDYKREHGLQNLNYISGPIEIGDNSWIGASVIILRGTKIGKNCVVAAGTILSGRNCYPENSIISQKKDTIVKRYQYCK